MKTWQDVFSSMQQQGIKFLVARPDRWFTAAERCELGHKDYCIDTTQTPPENWREIYRQAQVDGVLFSCGSAGKFADYQIVGFTGAGGIKHDSGKLRWDLLPPEPIEGIVKVLTIGAAKYSDRNWESGMSWSRVFAALMRHLWAWWRGEDNDPETGESHLDHAACCILFLRTYAARCIGTDDRLRGPYNES